VGVTQDEVALLRVFNGDGFDLHGVFSLSGWLVAIVIWSVAKRVGGATGVADKISLCVKCHFNKPIYHKFLTISVLLG